MRGREGELSLGEGEGEGEGEGRGRGGVEPGRFIFSVLVPHDKGVPEPPLYMCVLINLAIVHITKS